MRVKLLTENHLEFLSLRGGCTGSSDSTLDKTPHCWKSHVISDILREIEFLKADEWLSDVVCVGESQAEPEDLLQKEIDQNLNL